MNKYIMVSVHSRLGYWIKNERRRLLELTNNPKLRQDKFILLNEDEHFFDFVTDEAICSRATLSRIENGKVVYEKSLIDFFLKRFNKKHRICESDFHLIDSTINAYYVYLFSNCNIDLSYLNLILDDANDKISENILWDEDYIVLKKILKWFDHFEVLSVEDYLDLFKKFNVYHEKLKEILIYYLCFSVYFNPELWIFNKDLKQLVHEDYPDNKILSIFIDLFSNHEVNVIRKFYQYRHLILENSFLYKVSQPVKNIFDPHSKFSKYTKIRYFGLIQKLISKDYSADYQFESILFGYLNEYEISKNKNINELLIQIKDEPNPKIINKIVLQRIYPKIKSKEHMFKMLEFILE